QALLLFLNARLYLYNNIYYHRTVRRIDLHMREIFRETIERILTGNPLDQPDKYRKLTDWSLIDTVARWRHEGGRAAELSGERWRTSSAGCRSAPRWCGCSPTRPQRPRRSGGPWNVPSTGVTRAWRRRCRKWRSSRRRRSSR